MYPSLFLLVTTYVLIFYSIYVYLYDNEDNRNNNSVFMILAIAGAIGLLTRATAYAEVNYDFNPLKGKWNYSLIDKNK